MPRTYHLALVPEWSAGEGDDTYAPSAYAREGFIHCTDGEPEMVATANRYYRGHPGPFVVLEVDLDRVDVPVQTDDRGIYPHIHGRLPRVAVTAVLTVERDADGTFTRFGDASRP